VRKRPAENARVCSLRAPGQSVETPNVRVPTRQESIAPSDPSTVLDFDLRRSRSEAGRQASSKRSDSGKQNSTDVCRSDRSVRPPSGVVGHTALASWPVERRPSASSAAFAAYFSPAGRWTRFLPSHHHLAHFSAASGASSLPFLSERGCIHKISRPLPTLPAHHDSLVTARSLAQSPLADQRALYLAALNPSCQLHTSQQPHIPDHVQFYRTRRDPPGRRRRSCSRKPQGPLVNGLQRGRVNPQHVQRRRR
jgi:hypothetical protein